MNRNFLKKKEGVGGHSGQFRKVPWYFFVIPFVKEVGWWLFSEISKSQHMFHQKSTCRKTRKHEFIILNAVKVD